MRTFIYMFFIILFAMPVFAKKVDVETAKSAAKNLYFLRVNQVKDVKSSQINLSLAYTEVVNNEPVYYVFNVNTTEGFVIISADDIAKPCIGYSFEGPFVTNNQAPSFQYWISGFRDQIADAVSKKVTASAEATQEWAKLLTSTPVLEKSKSIQPLLLTIWNQDAPYNAFCPVDAAGPGGHVYAGCVATAMSQVMKYYNYPDFSIGTSHTIPSYLNPNYNPLTINFAAPQTYVWEEMPNSITTTSSNTEIARLMYHCGVGVNMAYAADGSGAYSANVPAVLESHFNYNTNCQQILKSNYATTALWENALRAQIDLKQPMIYSGSDATSNPPGSGGHAWNCDGYNASEFHMNWGWGGSENGFFTIGTIVASSYDFNYGNGAIVNIYPNTNYPEWCTPSAKLITGVAGTFNDGSGNQNYLDNQNCHYLIQPPCASFVTLTFDRFDLGTGDVVKVYNGATTSDPLLGTFDASNLPTAAISATNGALLLEFLTDGSNNATGWYASYNTYPCQGTKILTDPSGSIVDGSNSCDYAGSLICYWNIQPANANAFQLDFTQFNLAADPGDKVLVYKNTLVSAPLTFTSTNIPTTLNLIATKVIIKFSTNSSIASAGWAVNYTTTLTGIENNLSEFSTGIFPNPFSNDATISYTLTDVTNVKITVTNILGDVVGTYNKQELPGTYNLPLSSFSEQISQGMYFVNLSFNDKETTVKIICTK